METQSELRTGMRLVTVKQLCEAPGYEWATESTIRHLVFAAEPRIASNGAVLPGNGLSEIGAILRLGRRVLLDLDRLDAWLDRHRTNANSQTVGE